MSGGLFEIVLSEFECPVCMDFASPPIHQCLLGHILCKACFDQISVCPKCRGAKNEDRAYLYEELHNEFPFPCKYREEGCTNVEKGPGIVNHQTTCDFRTKLCPLYDVVECNWIGTANKIFEHCEEAHGDYVRKGFFHVFTFENFERARVEKAVFTIIQAHGETFQLCFCIYPDGHTRWRFLSIGFENDIERFDCLVTIGRKSKISFELKCSNKIVNEDVFLCEKCHIIPTEVLQNVCKESDDALIYNINVIDRGFELFLSSL